MSRWSCAAFRSRGAAHGRHPAGHRQRDAGAATAEFAVALPAFVVLLFAGLSSVNAVAARLACVGAARDGAIAEARGEDGAAVADERAPDGATVLVGRRGETVTVTVRIIFRPLGSMLPGIPISSSATAAVEPATP